MLYPSASAYYAAPSLRRAEVAGWSNAYLKKFLRTSEGKRNNLIYAELLWRTQPKRYRAAALRKAIR